MTKANDTTPTRRLLLATDGFVVVELNARMITIRPKGSRRGGPSEVSVGASQLYDRLLAGRAGFSTLPLKRPRGRR